MGEFLAGMGEAAAGDGVTGVPRPHRDTQSAVKGGVGDVQCGGWRRGRTGPPGLNQTRQGCSEVGARVCSLDWTLASLGHGLGQDRLQHGFVQLWCWSAPLEEGKSCII